MKTLSINVRSETTALKQPKEIGHFSKTMENEYINDDSQLQYFYFPDSDLDRNIDLTGGFKKFRKVDPELDQCSLKGMLGCLMETEKLKGKKTKGDIITFRGIIKKLMMAPYDKFEKVDLRVVSFDGQIFIKDARKEEDIVDEKLKKMIYGGYKFESVSTIPKPISEVSRATLEKRHKKIVNNIEQYCTVVRTGVGKVKLVLGAEVDCVFDFKTDGDNLAHYAELKTARIITEPKNVVQFECKLFNTWAQCFLVGINRIIYGFRDDNMILKTVEEYSTNEIPIILKENAINPQKKFNCTDALKWHGAVTQWIVDNVPVDHDKAYKLYFEDNFLKLQELGDVESEDLLNGGVITHEFREWREKLRSTA